MRLQREDFLAKEVGSVSCLDIAGGWFGLVVLVGKRYWVCSSSSMFTGVSRTVDKTFNSMSVTKRLPASILWMAFLLMSRPAIWSRSAKARWEIPISIRNAAIFSPHKLFFPVSDLLMNITFSLQALTFTACHFPYGMLK